MRAGRIVIMLIVGVLIAAGAFFGWNYYQDRYVSDDYYAMVPLDADVTPETMYASGGEEMGLGKEFKLQAYSPEGEARTLEFTVYAIGSGMASERELPNPGDYLLIKASKQVVNNWSTVSKDEVPAKALEKIEGEQ